jgi:hypothetical protein
MRHAAVAAGDACRTKHMAERLPDADGGNPETMVA